MSTTLVRSLLLFALCSSAAHAQADKYKRVLGFVGPIKESEAMAHLIASSAKVKAKAIRQVWGGKDTGGRSVWEVHFKGKSEHVDQAMKRALGELEKTSMVVKDSTTKYRLGFFPTVKRVATHFKFSILSAAAMALRTPDRPEAIVAGGLLGGIADFVSYAKRSNNKYDAWLREKRQK